jgi:hypothetical protein
VCTQVSSKNTHLVEPYPTATVKTIAVVRSNPVKTTPTISSGGVTVVAPKPHSVPRATRPIVPLLPSPSQQYKPQEEIIVKNEPKAKPSVTVTAAKKEPWCDEATALARRNKQEEQKKKKIEEQSRRQEIQTNFPEDSDTNTNMPPMNGGAPADDELDGGDGTAQAYQQQQQQQARLNKNRTSSASSYGARRSNNIHMRGNDDGEAASRALAQQPTPLFERLVTEEVQEIKSYVRIIENQSRRLSELERFHGDLEGRLELESRGRQQLESTLEAREREWAHKYSELESDRDHWKAVVQAEQTKNSRLIDQVVRKDQDIHRMLQRKVRRFENFGLINSCLPHLTLRVTSPLTVRPRRQCRSLDSQHSKTSRKTQWSGDQQ